MQKTCAMEGTKIIEFQHKPDAVGSLEHSTVHRLQLQPPLWDDGTCMLLQTCMFQSSGNTVRECTILIFLNIIHSTKQKMGE